MSDDDGSGSGSESDEPIKWFPPEEFHIPHETQEEEEWNEDHVKLAYMIFLYAKCAQTPEDKESWIRELPMMCIVYEGVVCGALDFDYAPCSMLVSYEGRSRRRWLNISQEGKAAVDDLREKDMLNGLKLSTEDFQPVTAYQISMKGLAFLKDCCTEEMKEDVRKYCYPGKDDPPPPAGKETELLLASFDGDSFQLGNSYMSRESQITEAEDVSYVSSPYLPPCLRSTDKLMTSNEHRADEAAAGGSNIQDELDEAVVLNGVHGLVGEWIPFGSNQIVALNERLGALDRCQGGLFTAQVDKSPTDTKFSVPPGLTQVTILDYDFVHFINFEAEINYPEEEGIVQVENFGMHLNVDGTIIYGVFIDAVVDRKSDDISVDHLSRLLVDIHQDSSQIMNDLLSQYQRSLLDMIYMGDTMMRSKFNCIIADDVVPANGKMPADDYIDKSDHENELKQVLGDIHSAHDLSKDDIVIMGRTGILFGGPKVMSNTTMICAFVSLLTREVFIGSFFVRTFVLDDSLKIIRTLIMTYQKDPNNIQKIRDRLNDASRDIILLQEVLEYLKESLEEMKVPPMIHDQVGKRLFKVLDVPQMKDDIMMRCTDLVKLIHGARNTLMTLQRMSDVINTKQLEDVFKNVQSNTKYLVDASAANERSSASLEVMQVILAGSFAFDIVDRLSGGTLNIVVPNWVVEGLVVPIISIPFLFWILNMCWLGAMSIALIKFMGYLAAQALGALTLRVRVNRKINVEKLNEFTASRSVDVYDFIQEEGSILKKMTWTEEDDSLWGGSAATIEIYFDETNQFLLSVYFQIDTKKTKFREPELVAKFTELLIGAGVYEEGINMDQYTKKMSMLNVDDPDDEDGKDGDDKAKVMPENKESKEG